jgi:hypothetical protein
VCVLCLCTAVVPRLTLGRADIVDALAEDAPRGGRRSLAEYVEADLCKSQVACKEWRGVVGTHHTPTVGEWQRALCVPRLSALFSVVRVLMGWCATGRPRRGLCISAWAAC